MGLSSHGRYRCLSPLPSPLSTHECTHSFSYEHTREETVRSLNISWTLCVYILNTNYYRLSLGLIQVIHGASNGKPESGGVGSIWLQQRVSAKLHVNSEQELLSCH